MKLSVLDQSPIGDNEKPFDALRHTIALAQRAEKWGYHRFWVAEHHNSDRNMGSSPEVLMSHLLARTNHIRIGSGGVMLQHYSPYKVAENFNLLATLAPGRVDLGVGRGPGGLPQSTLALRPQPPSDSGLKSLDDKLAELKQFIHNRLDEDHPCYGLTATPVPDQPANLFLLGATAASAQAAAALALPYVFALFLNGDAEEMGRAVATYRQEFDRSHGNKPQAMLALPVIAADSDAVAAKYAATIRIVRLTLASGRSFTLFSPAAAQEFARQAQEDFTYEIQPAQVIHGAPAQVVDRLQTIGQDYGVEELFIVTALQDYRKRFRSYRLLSEAMLKT